MAELLDQFVWVLIDLVDGRENALDSHSRRVGALAFQMAQLYDLPTYQASDIRYAGLLHDLGKIHVPDSIRFKPGPLTGEERAIMRQHPGWSSQILARVDDLQPAIGLVKHHHERWDGCGYPDCLRREEIPLGAQIVGIAEVFDSLIMPTCYRQPWPVEQVKNYLLLHSGRMFDTQIVEAFLTVVKEKAPVEIE